MQPSKPINPCSVSLIYTLRVQALGMNKLSLRPLHATAIALAIVGSSTIGGSAFTTGSVGSPRVAVGNRRVTDTQSPAISSHPVNAELSRIALKSRNAETVEQPSAMAKLKQVKHFVVIYQENHSFDNLYGTWEGVRGIHHATTAQIQQVNQRGSRFTCLRQTDVNLISPPLPNGCHDVEHGFFSAFRNALFQIDQWIKPTDTTCPDSHETVNGVLKGKGLPGGCTQDVVHRFYQHQYQLNGGKMNRYVVGSNAVGLAMGYYDTQQLPIYRYLHQPNHPKYAIADNFFQAAFGGSFLNHQWLIAAATPVVPNAVVDGSAKDLHSIIDANGMPKSYSLYKATVPVKDAPLTVKCPAPIPGLACGNYAVNTIQPPYQPYKPGTPVAKRLPAQVMPTIGDRLSAARVDWAWYAGGWSNANGDVGAPGWTNGHGSRCTDPNTINKAVYPNCPHSFFQFHHQPFNYYANYAPGTSARQAHLRDEVEFLQTLQTSVTTCGLKSVSFVKPIGPENEHPGYASAHRGNDHLVSLIHAIHSSACAKDTMIIVTYDEFGGQWDHLPPPGQGDRKGVFDQWGPGNRVPTLILSPLLQADFVVSHTSHDTTSILATLETRFNLPPLSRRDATVKTLASVFSAVPPTH